MPQVSVVPPPVRSSLPVGGGRSPALMPRIGMNPYLMPRLVPVMPVPNYAAAMSQLPATSYIATTPPRPPVATTTSSSANRPDLETKPEASIALEPAVRLRYVQFDVTGVRDAADGEILRINLEKLTGVKGSTVKRKGDGPAVVKVWYSEKEPVAANDIITATSKLGYSAVVAAGN